VGANSGFKAYQKRLSIIKNGWYRRQVEDIRTLVNPNLALNRLFLIKNFWQLRRKPKEVIILLFLLVLGLY
jgi:rhamnosyltransferase